MIRLFGFPLSNYYSIVKMCLMEKRIDFEERTEHFVVAPDVLTVGDSAIAERHVDYFTMSPVGKVPCIGTRHGYLSETQVILDYLEDAYPQPPLLPSDAFARAKARELVRVLDLHVELVMRRVYPQAFFGGAVAPETKAEVHELLSKGIAGIAALTRLSRFAVGTAFTHVDCVAAIHLPILQTVMTRVYGEDLQQTLPNLPDYLAGIAERPSYQAATATIRSTLAELAQRTA